MTSELVPIPAELATPEGMNALAAAEKRGYQKGYAARVRRTERGDRQEQRAWERQDFRRQVFLTVLPEAFNAQNWTRGKEGITSMDARIDLAWDFADQAMKRYY